MSKFFATTFLILMLLLPSPNNAFAIKINEILANPTGEEPEWVELYSENTSGFTNYYFKDKAGTKKTIESSTNCAPYFVWELQSTTGWLNNNGEESIYLYDPNDILVDKYESWESPDKGKTISRIPDSSENFKITEQSKCAANVYHEPTPTPQPTPVTSNSVSAPTPGSSAKKSPSPTPKVLGTASTPSPVVKSTENNSTKTANTLQDSISSLQENELNSPGTSPAVLGAQDARFAPILIGSGLSLMGLAGLGFLYYKKNLESNKIAKSTDRFKNKENEETND